AVLAGWLILWLSAALRHHSFGVGDGAGRVQALRAGVSAVHDRVAAIKSEWVVESVESLTGALIAAIGEATIRMQQDRRAEILALVPPVAWAGGRAAEAQDALPRAVELGSLLWRLTALAVRRRLIALQPGFD